MTNKQIKGETMNEKNDKVKIQSAIKQLQDNANLPWGCSISKEASEDSTAFRGWKT